MTSPTDARKRENDARKREQDEMVKTAAALTASVEKMDPMPRALATADSSGFVDMSAFSASDPDWVENALANARGDERKSGDVKASDRPKPTPTVRGILLVPQTLRPVALSELIEPPPKDARRVSAFAAGVVGACVAIAVGGFALSRIARTPDAFAEAAISDALRDAALGLFVVQSASPESSAPPIASALPSSSPSSSAPTPSASVVGTAPPKTPVKATAIGASPRARPTPASAPKPRATATGGSPSLEEMMRRAAQPPAKPKK